ncbi:hypothetical protein ACLB1Q_07430 [Escherichia coli]
MMQVLADEYQQRLRVNCINPGGSRAMHTASAFPTEDPQKLQKHPLISCRSTFG